MPRSKKSKISYLTMLSILIGFSASVLINLASTWFQQTIIPNRLYEILAGILAIGVLSWVIKVRSPILTIAFLSLVFGVLINVSITPWVQKNVLHDTYSPEIITEIGLLTILGLVLGPFIESQPMKKMTRTVSRNLVILRSEKTILKRSSQSQSRRGQRQQSKPKQRRPRRPQKQVGRNK